VVCPIQIRNVRSGIEDVLLGPAEYEALRAKGESGNAVSPDIPSTALDLPACTVGNHQGASLPDETEKSRFEDIAKASNEGIAVGLVPHRKRTTVRGNGATPDLDPLDGDSLIDEHGCVAQSSSPLIRLGLDGVLVVAWDTAAVTDGLL
jgi:hypothetical protein